MTHTQQSHAHGKCSFCCPFPYRRIATIKCLWPERFCHVWRKWEHLWLIHNMGENKKARRRIKGHWEAHKQVSNAKFHSKYTIEQLRFLKISILYFYPPFPFCPFLLSVRHIIHWNTLFVYCHTDDLLSSISFSPCCFHLTISLKNVSHWRF